MSEGIRVGASTCIATVITDDFLLGGVVTIGSFLQHHPDPEVPVIVLYESRRAPLSASSRAMLEAISPRVRCIEAADSAFWAQRDELASRIGTPARLQAAFLILEVFRMREVERVVAIDSDLICLQPCPELFDTDASFAAVRAFDKSGAMPRAFFNSGVLTVGGLHLSGTTFNDLMHHTSVTNLPRGSGLADQAVLNAYFNGRVRWLDPSLNSAKRLYPDAKGPLDDQFRQLPPRIVHYVGAKPWDRQRDPEDHGYTQVERLWWDTLRTLAPDAVSTTTVFASGNRTP